MPYENKYRDYLTGKRPYRAYLDKPQESSAWADVAGYGLAALGLAGGGYAAFKSGAFREPMRALIERLSSYEEGPISNLLGGIRKWGAREEFGIMSHLANNKWDIKAGIESFARDIRQELPKAIEDYTNRTKPYVQTELEQRFIEYNQIAETIGNRDAEVAQLAREEMQKAMRKEHLVPQSKQDELMKQTGYRNATVRDYMSGVYHDLQTGELKGGFLEQLEHKDIIDQGMSLFGTDFLNFVVDKDIMIDPSSKIRKLADLRKAKRAAWDLYSSAREDFTFPFVNINPIQMFTPDFLTRRQKFFFGVDREPMFFIHDAKNYDPIAKILAGLGDANQPLGKDLLSINGTVYDIEKAKEIVTTTKKFDPVEQFMVDVNTTKKVLDKVAENTYLSPSQYGAGMRLIHQMFNITTRRFSGPRSGFTNRALYNVSDFLDIGFQEKATRGLVWGDPTSILSGMSNYITKKFRPWDVIQDRPMEQVLTKNPSYFLMQKMKMPGVDGFLSQFVAGRHDPKNVTTATLLPYNLFERLNSSIGQVGAALSPRSLGSAVSVFSNLALLRGLPIVGGIAAWNYLNYEGDNFTGTNPNKILGKLTVGTSLAGARVRDSLGITDWAKHFGNLFPGGEQITEIPFFGKFFDLNDSEEELKKFWAEGMVPIRKGRWWPFGNTPFTGGKIDHWEPNWVRKVNSEWEFTSTKYGSADEYWANAPWPTPRYPLAPIRHFMTDPYHFEKKHYYDRPYLLTGSIPELGELPLIGSSIGEAVSSFFKPQHKMHPEVWAKLAQGGSQDEVSPDLTHAMWDYQVQMAGFSVIANGQPKGGGSGTGGSGGGSGGTGGGSGSGGGTGKKKFVPVNIPGFDKPAEDISTSAYDNVELDDEGLTDVYDRSIVNPGSASGMGRGFYDSLTEIGGFYGFAAESFTGRDDSNYIATSRAMTSPRRSFWDLDIGGYGGDINEIGRRFIGRREKWEKQFNPVRNQMPSWMPGDEYFTDFKHGDPYVKINSGEMRLPGGAYEKLWGLADPMNMELGGSTIGKSRQDIVAHLLHLDEFVTNDEAIDYGTRQHSAEEKKLVRAGIALDTEQHVEDKQNHLTGFYDAKVDNRKFLEYYLKHGIINMGGVPIDEALSTAEALIDFKTMGAKKYEKNQLFQENVEQINFYMHATGINRAYLLYMNRDNPKDPTKVYAINYDEGLFRQTLSKVEDARNDVRDMIRKGLIGPADLYSFMDRYRILADVAPYSDQFRAIKKMTRLTDLKPQDLENIKEMNDRTQEQKQALRLYPYRFQTADIKKQVVTVDRVINNNTFYVKEYPDNPIRLAGVAVSNAKNNDQAEAARKMVGSRLIAGSKVTIGYDSDPLNMIKNDTYSTIPAVVWAGGENLNQALIRSGIGKEKTEDYSPPAVHARFTAGQIGLGKLWERIAHLDTPVNTKFLQVRSPLESFRRRDLYGKDWQEWTDPVSDYIVPWYQNLISRNPLVAMLAGGSIGYLFGNPHATEYEFLKGYTDEFGNIIKAAKTNSYFGRIMGAAVGATVVGIGALTRSAYEQTSGEKWIPQRRKQERDLNEYMDILKYIKYSRLYEAASAKAKTEEGVDVTQFIKGRDNKLSANKQYSTILSDYKRQLYKASEGEAAGLISKMNSDLKRAGYRGEAIRGKDKAEMMHAVNQTATAITEARRVIKNPPQGKYAQLALDYYQQAEETMYGYDGGDPVTNLLKALPKKDRQYLMPFVEAPEEDREEILGLVPNYMRRALESMWGMPVEDKPDLRQYFREHQLPNKNWAGWWPEVDLDDIKIKIINREGMDTADFNLWPEDQMKASKLNKRIKAPNYHGTTNASDIRGLIYEIMHGAGFEDIQVDVAPHTSTQVDVDIARDRRAELKSYIDTNANLLM